MEMLSSAFCKDVGSIIHCRSVSIQLFGLLVGLVWSGVVFVRGQLTRVAENFSDSRGRQQAHGTSLSTALLCRAFAFPVFFHSPKRCLVQDRCCFMSQSTMLRSHEAANY